MFGRGFELDAVGLEARRELPHAVVGDRHADSVTVGEGPGHGVAQPGRDLLVVAHAEPVDDQQHLVGTGFGADAGQHLFDEFRLAVHVDAHESVGEQQRELLDNALPLGQDERCGNNDALILMGEEVFGHVIRRVAAHLLTRYGREGVAYAGEEQFEVVVDFGRGADGRTRVARIDLLFDGDGRCDALDEVDIRFVDLAEELPGIGREALDIASLPFGEDRVEGQRRFAGARQTGDDDQFLVRDFQRDIAQVVNPRTLDIYAVFVFFHIATVPCLGPFMSAFLSLRQ